MEINVTRLGPLVNEVRLLRAEVMRLCDLYELYLQKELGFTTRVEQARPEDLNETRVDYTDPDFSRVVGDTEKRLGRTLTEEESAKIWILMKEDEEDRD